MKTITFPEEEYFSNKTGEFIRYSAVTIKIEHSLVSISKWESKWHKPFLSMTEFTVEELLDYIRCMTITKRQGERVDPEVYERLTQSMLDEILEYIRDPMTATTIKDTTPAKPNNEVVTSELIYYWMTALNIPFECQYWHLNRLLTLIRVCNIKNKPPKEMSKNEIYARQRALNNSRRAKYK